MIDDIRARIATADPPPRALLLDFEAIFEIDTQGADALVHLCASLRERNVKVVIARAHASVIDYLRRDGSLEAFGIDNVFPRIQDAADALD